ncbi:hypothetical protein SNOG_01176 [Parastagonospora nodorum SN15]|uniref:Uncharacterized protein n=1 Tax=Phaeosphaeria nodorum (strain SN15 / ATCC MYA-4574 / FGSC 10173) TaxID=321614 RepID=Q0V488_PHANO|nr:hypothetical protein SNOG_01176 [Parastagonospora nodorum SN15]EAT90825.1 hypothetical protein SNOG_01176 [Parastagonospora nodorum SN15]
MATFAHTHALGLGKDHDRDRSSSFGFKDTDQGIKWLWSEENMLLDQPAQMQTE